MAKAVQSPVLKAAFTQRERETRGQVKRLDRVFKIIGEPARGKTCWGSRQTSNVIGAIRAEYDRFGGVGVSMGN